MENAIPSVSDLISEWPTRKALADQIGANVDAVHKWHRAGRIPSAWQAVVLAAAKSRGVSYATADWMIAAHSAAKAGAA